jgi:hypothetical protein
MEAQEKSPETKVYCGLGKFWNFFRNPSKRVNEFFLFLPDFFEFFENGETNKVGESYVQLFVAKLL